MSPRRQNRQRNNFLENLPKITIENTSEDIKKSLRFSFKYFDNSQEPGQGFSDWECPKLIDLLEKLKEYSKKTKKELLNMRVGAGGLHILEIYGSFPISAKTDFVYPKHVPVDVQWARFRLSSTYRIIGFFISNDNSCKFELDSNTFYLVFLDKDHRFYKT